MTTPKNTLKPQSRNASAYFATLLTSLAAVSTAQAADGSLVSSYTGGNMTWTDTTKWVSGTVANGTDAIATLSNNYTAGGTISGVTGSLGSLVFEDTTPSNNLIILTGSLAFAKSAGTPTVSVSNSGNVGLNLNITATGTQGLTVTNSGTTTTRFNGSWSGLTGVFTLDGGTFAPQAGNILPSATGSSISLINNAVLNPGATSGRTQSVVGMDGTSGTSLRIAGTSGYTFGTNSTSGQSFNFAGNIIGANASGDTGAITKNGVSTQKLSGSNTYYGTTTINGGTLLVNGTHIAALDGGAYTVNSGGTLGGTGTITPKFATGGGVMIDVKSGGIVAPGDGGIGTLTFDQTASARTNLWMNSGATFSFDLGAGVTSDRISFVGSATVTDAGFNSNTINFTDLTGGSLSTGDYLLFAGDSNTDYSGLTTVGAFTGTSISGTLITAGLAVGTGLSGYNSSTLFMSGNNIYLNVSAVPEPSSIAALAGLASVGFAACRRRRRA